MTDGPYKIASYALNRVISLTRLNEEEEKDFLRRITKSFKSKEEQVSIISYVKILIEELVIGGEDLLDSIDRVIESSKDPGVEEDLLSEIYRGIVKIYSNYSLEIILGIINNSINLDNVPHREEEKDKLLAFWASLGILDNLSFVKDDAPLKDDEVGNFGTDPKIPKAKPVPKKVKAKKKTSQIKVESTSKAILGLRKKLKEKIIGQDEAVDQVIDQVKNIVAGLYSRSNLFFLGPTGVGKTELSKTLAKELFKGDHFYKINCAEYSKGHEVSKLIGAPPGYVGFGDTPILKRLAKESNQWVILFDEIEKAHTSLYDFALSLLDDGTASDNQGSTLDFSRSIFLFTSNNGMREVNLGSRKVGFGGEKVEYEDSKEMLKSLLSDRFPPEFLGRMDEVIYFNQLSKEDIKKIAELELDFLPIKITNKLIDFVVEGGYSKEYGARYMNRFIKSTVAPIISDALLESKLPKNSDKYSVRVTKSGISIINTKELKNESKR